MQYSDSTGAAVRHANAVAVLESLRAALAEPAGTLTVTALADRTQLSRPTVDAVVAELNETSVARVGAPVQGGRGRPARNIRFAAELGCVAGIDAGSHTIRIQLADLAGRELSSTTTAIPRRLKPGERLSILNERMRADLKAVGLSVGKLRAAGLAVPGILDGDDRLAESINAPEWVGEPLTQQLKRLWRCPVGIENDIKLAALAEHKVGAAQADQISYWQLGHRLSLASIINGRILHGHHRIAGELGTRRGLEWTSTSQKGVLRWQTGTSAKAVFDAAARGDDAALAEVSTFCAEIAPLIVTVVLTTDPELVVVGGGLSRAGATLIEPLQREIHALLTTTAKPPVVPSHLSADATVVGALGLAFERFSADIVGVASIVPPWSAWETATTP